MEMECAGPHRRQRGGVWDSLRRRSVPQNDGELEMETAVVDDKMPVLAYSNTWEESYRPLPFLFFGLFIIWVALAGMWTANTWSKRRWQTNNLQWVLTTVPVLKALVLGLSFVFWYSCLNLSSCSFWVAFGVFVSRIFFETSCFTAFLLISHGYCIMHEQLSLSERRSIAGLASLLYLILTGYKAAIPQFVVLVVVMYVVLLYVIFLHISRNLLILKEQLQYMHDEGVHMMQTAVSAKYTMFKKFQGAMFVIVATEILMHSRPEGVANEYWMRLVVREWTEIGIFFYIGWTFRSRELTPFFTVIPTLHSSAERTLPPIYTVEMNKMDFNSLNFKEWHIGVPTSVSEGRNLHWPVLVIVQNPGISLSSETIYINTASPEKKPQKTKEDVSCPSAQHGWGIIPTLVYSLQAGNSINVKDVASMPIPSTHSCKKPSLDMLFSVFKPYASKLQMDVSGTTGDLQLLNEENGSGYSVKDVVVDVKVLKNCPVSSEIPVEEENLEMKSHFLSETSSSVVKFTR